jgi:hypothetical protein
MIQRRLATVLLAACLAQACSAGPEQTIIADFFAASRLRDLTALSRFATVVFEPREQGTVTTFTIRNVSAERAAGPDRVKEVTIDAPVHRPDGSIVETVFVVRLQLHARATETSAPALYSGWLVTGISEQLRPGGLPPS